MFNKENKVENDKIKVKKAKSAINVQKETETKQNLTRSKFVLKRKNAMRKIIQKKNEFDYLILEKLINENLNEDEEDHQNNEYLDDSQQEIEYIVHKNKRKIKELISFSFLIQRKKEKKIV